MKRNYIQSITTHAAPITSGKLTFTDFKAKVIGVPGLRIADI